MTDHLWHCRLLVLLALGGAALLTACASEPQVIPTVFVLPSPSNSPVPTVVLPTITPLVITRPPLLPTATRPTPTPSPTFTPTPETLYVEGVSSERDTVVVALHDNCLPQITRIRAVVRSVTPLQAVVLDWVWLGHLSSRPGIAMGPVGQADWAADLGPFDRDGMVVYWVAARDINGVEALSAESTLEVIPCEAPSPTPTRPPGPVSTATPPYGEALSVHALDQEVVVGHNTPTPIVLTWEGGVPPYTLDQITQPVSGTLSGAGPSRVYTPNPNFSGPDRFTFRVLDGNGQASRGTITLLVMP